MAEDCGSKGSRHVTGLFFGLKESHGPAGSGRIPHLLRRFIPVPWCLVLSLQICRCSPREVPVHSRRAGDIISMCERLILPAGRGCWQSEHQMLAWWLIAYSSGSGPHIQDRHCIFVHPFLFQQDKKKKGPEWALSLRR